MDCVSAAEALRNGHRRSLWQDDRRAIRNLDGFAISRKLNGCARLHILYGAPGTRREQVCSGCSSRAISFSLRPVKSELPFVTIIIPTRPGQKDVPAVSAARLLDYPRERLEIIVARG